MPESVSPTLRDGPYCTQFAAWIDPLNAEEFGELWPEWIETCVVIGEEPETANYLLMPTTGELAGYVFRFDHDGFEFTDCAIDLIDYVEKLLAPDDQLLLEVATYMRFVDGDSSIQWWIREMRDNRGNVARAYV